MKRLLLLLLLLPGFTARAAVWQWSVPLQGGVSAETGAAPRAYLWIPPEAGQLRGVVVGQHNMSEEQLFEHPLFRKRMSALGFAIVWITPILDMPWDPGSGCQALFDRMLADLAAASGYDELAAVPVVPVGHSALATFPWNFAAANPGRTLAVVSLHGDAPRTNLTGYGRANVEWGRTRNIDGIPGLMIEGEYEWWEARVRPALAFRMFYPGSCISFLGDAGRGHFDLADATVDYIARFLEKAAEQRLGTPLRPVDPTAGWLAERWRPDQTRRARPAPAARYKCDPHDAFWYFDREMAELAERRYAETRGKKPLCIGFAQSGEPLPYDERLHARIRGRFRPEADGVTFRLQAFFSDSTHRNPTANRPAGEPRIGRICGPVEQIDDTTFRIRFGRGTLDNARRGGELWLLAEHPGDHRHKSAVQQLLIEIPHRNTEGREQHIDFPPLPDLRRGEAAPLIAARSDAGLPVSYFVEEGPAEVCDGVLRLSPIPPRARLPLRITVVAWQYGIAGSVRSAEPVRRSFCITE